MKKIAQLVLWILILQLVGYALGMITTANLTPWYTSLNKSSLTPPGYVFGIVWGILYVMLAIVGWLLFQNTTYRTLSTLKFIFIAQLILNWLWTPLFFYFHWIGLALICLFAIVLLTTTFLLLAGRYVRALFWLILPYWAWICFAAYLNFMIWYIPIVS